MNRTTLVILGASIFLSACASISGQERHIATEDSLSWVRHKGIEKVVIDDTLVVIRADALLASIVLINPPQSAGSIARLAARENLAVAINAAMFAKDYATSIGYMRNYDTVNNPRFSSKLKGFLMFNPKSPNSPAVKIGSREEIEEYHTAFQSYRMWTASEGILWKKGVSIHRQVGLVGADGKGRILFFYHPNETDVHEMVARILELKLDLQGLLYLDGGFHGSLHLAPELGRGWNTWVALPNVLGVKTR